MFLVLSGSLLTFILITVFFVFSMLHAGKTLDDQTEALAGSAAEYAEELLEAEIKKRMEETTRMRAQAINNGLMETCGRRNIYFGRNERSVAERRQVFRRACSRCHVYRRSSR